MDIEGFVYEFIVFPLIFIGIGAIGYDLFLKVL